MGDRTAISWTDATWNPVRGCSQVSPGCANCYAKHQAARIVRMAKGKPSKYERLVRLTARGEPAWTGFVELDPATLADPLRWRRPRRVFVNSMSDLFHESLTNEQIAAVFGVMAASWWHTHQALTKRSRRAREWFAWLDSQAGCDTAKLALVLDAAAKVFADNGIGLGRGTTNQERHAVWPLRNLWLGVSVENQDAADERIPELLATPAAVRFLSCEPLLGPVDLHRLTAGFGDDVRLPEAHYSALQRHHDDNYYEAPNVIDWVIVGCESGPGARRCDVAWLRSLRDQCASADVPFFLKQAEESVNLGADRQLDIGDDDSIAFGDGSKLKGRGPAGCRIVELPYLDGVQHAAFPGVPR